MTVTEAALPVSDPIAADAARLMQLRRERAASRAHVRAIVDALVERAQARLGAVLANDPVSGYPACLLIATTDKLGPDYESQSPRPRPDTISTVRIELLGRVLSIELDDFGRARIGGIPDVADYTRVDDGPYGPVFTADAADGENREDVPDRIGFDALLGRLVATVLADEEAERERGEPPDFVRPQPAPAQKPAEAGAPAAG